MHHHLPSAAGCSRRDVIVASGAGLGFLGLAGVLADAGELAAPPVDPLAVKQPHFAPRARRVIQFFLNGGPSHIDTFDPKPLIERYARQPLPVSLTTERKTGGGFPSRFRFQKYGDSGLDVSELFARTAARCTPSCRTTSPR
jgi:hypothetical protein